MQYLVVFSRTIDRANWLVGQGLRWIALVLVVLGVVNVVGRYLGAQLSMQLSSNSLLEAQIQAFNVMFLLGGAYLLLENGHIRVDVLHSKFSAHTKAWIDFLGSVLLLIPFCLLMLGYSFDYVLRAWQRLEVSPNPGGLPLYPIKTVLLIGFTLLLLQGVSQAIKAAAVIRQGRQ